MESDELEIAREMIARAERPVVFTGAELWGPDAEPTTTISVDAWESYLEHA